MNGENAMTMQKQNQSVRASGKRMGRAAEKKESGCEPVRHSTGLASALLAGALALMFPVVLPAHHGDAGYDTTKMVQVKGMVTDYQFVNPHVEISLQVKNENGELENWQAEMNSPNILSRASGWNRNTLKNGAEIVVEGHAAKRGLKVIRVEKVSLPDGTELFPRGGNGVTRF